MSQKIAIYRHSAGWPVGWPNTDHYILISFMHVKKAHKKRKLCTKLRHVTHLHTHANQTAHTSKNETVKTELKTHFVPSDKQIGNI